ncbi:hypothetical protein B0I03_101556 [Flavobacterium aquaticum]|uniref:Uncharacterized protein n=1 Tax=Flavobacterium aquaticum TaxID=1236486 RepID=A0A327YWA3_9FLAO|nr:hypothetical protein [Flavobacterium aquaticum]RAK25380.1 hypothetical protein B0I03_101556 [Flavobacterium aquaticum]
MINVADYFSILEKAPYLFDKIQEKVFLKTEIDIVYSDIKNWERFNLLSEYDESDKGNWNKISYSEYVWIKIVEQLKDFGSSNEEILLLKNHLVSKFKVKDYILLFDQVKNTIGEKDFEVYSQLYNDLNQVDFNQNLNFNILDILIVNIIYTGEQLSLFIRKDDLHYFLPFSETMLKEYSNSSVSSLVDDFLNFPFYNIPISSYVSNFLSNKNDVRHNSFTMILTEQESKLLKIIRKNFQKIKQLKVKYKTGNIELIEVTTIKKVALESRIINHIKKSDYKKITIDIANGNIVNFEDTEKIKL